MKNKLVNKRVINSIGIGVLALITSCTPVLAAGTEDIDIPEQPDPVEEPKEEPRPESENAEVSVALEDAKEAIGDAKDIIDTTANTNNYDDIKTDLTNTDTSIGNLQQSVNELDSLNQTAADAKEYLADIVSEEQKLLDGTANEGDLNVNESASSNISSAKETAGNIAESTEINAFNAEQKANAAEEAQSVIYGSREEAEAAQNQALAAAVEAEKALEDASAANLLAQESVESAKASLDFLTSQKENADRAYEAAQNAVAAAQAKLEEIRVKNGINGESGDADGARVAAEEALKKAQKELSNAAEEKDSADNAVITATEALTNANGALNAAENVLKAAETAYKNANITLETEARNLNNINAEVENQQKIYDEKKADLNEKNKDMMAKAVEEKNAKDALETAKKAVTTAEEKVIKAQENLDNATNYDLETLFNEVNIQKQTVNEAKAEWEQISDLTPFQKEKAKNNYYRQLDILASSMIEADFLQKNIEVSVDPEAWVTGENRNNHVEVNYEVDGNQCTEYFDYVVDDSGQITIVKKAMSYKNKDTVVPLTVSYENGKPVFMWGNTIPIDPDLVEGNAESGYVVKSGLTGEKVEYTYLELLGPQKKLIAVTIEQEVIYLVDGNIVEVEFDENNKITTVNGKKVSPISLVKKPNSDGEIKQSPDTLYGKSGTFASKGTSYLSEEEFNMRKNDYNDNLASLEEELTAAKEDAISAEAEQLIKEKDLNDATAAKESARGLYDSAKAEHDTAKLDLDNAKIQQTLIQSNYDKAKTQVLLTGLDLGSAYDQKKAKQTLVNECIAALNEATTVAQTAESKHSSAINIESAVKKAYEEVIDAIGALAELTSQQNVDEAAYRKLIERYTKASEDYEAALAAQGISKTNLDKVMEAAQRARAAADAVFAYNTNSEADGGNTEIGGDTGTGSGTEIGGNTETGSGTGINGGTGTGSGTGINRDTGTGGDTGIGSGTGTTPDGIGAETGVNIGTAGAGVMTPLATGVGAGTTGTAGAADGTAAAEGNAVDTDGLRPITDEDVPLADLNAGERNNDPNADSLDELQNVADEEVPLSDVKVDQMKMSWWWWLLILLLGSAGTKMYIDHQRKRKNEENKR